MKKGAALCEGSENIRPLWLGKKSKADMIQKKKKITIAKGGITVMDFYQLMNTVT